MFLSLNLKRVRIKLFYSPPNFSFLWERKEKFEQKKRNKE